MKMTEKQLLAIKKLIENAINGCDMLSTNEQQELQELRNSIDTEIYVQQIQSFVDYIKHSMPSSDDDVEKFYELKWTISFGSRSVTINNEATIYQDMLDAFNDFIDNCL